MHENEANAVPPMMYMDAIELARTMATSMAERDREKYKRPGDIIEHAKKCGAYDFYSMLNPEQAEKWIKTAKKAFTTLQLTNEEKMGNVYRLMFDKADD